MDNANGARKGPRGQADERTVTRGACSLKTPPDSAPWCTYESHATLARISTPLHLPARTVQNRLRRRRCNNMIDGSIQNSAWEVQDGAQLAHPTWRGARRGGNGGGARARGSSAATGAPRQCKSARESRLRRLP